MSRGAARSAVPALVAAVRARDLAAVRAALAGGADPRRFYDGETPLHEAARTGPLAVVEALIVGGALEWQRSTGGRTALDCARAGTATDRDAIVALLDRERTADPSFAAAVAAIHAGDVVALEGLLDAEPRLLTARNVGPEAYRKRERADYFRDPKLVWYVANNPTTVKRMAPNAPDVARAIVVRGVDRADLDYTLALVMSSAEARRQGCQLPLMRVLIEAGAIAGREAIAVAGAHGELEPLRELLARGMPPSAPIAAALGDADSLRHALPQADAEDVALAFGLAVINGHHEAARLALAAGTHVDAFLPVHTHATALHQAAANDDAAMIALLLRAGARADVHDTLWDGTALAWAEHEGNDAAVAALSGAG